MANPPENSQGWVRLPRELLNSYMFHNEKLWKVFTWCLLKATWKPREITIGRQKVKLEPGQFIFGRHAAARELNMKSSTAWDYIKLLEKHQNTNIKSNNKFSIITVNNWELWQGEIENLDNKPDNKPDNKSTTNPTQTRTKESKEVKKIYTPEFEAWYSSWPRAQAKQDSFKNFEQRRKKHGLEFLLQCSQNYLAYMTSITEKERGPYYSTNNFFGQKAYYLDFVEPKKPPRRRNTNAPPM